MLQAAVQLLDGSIYINSAYACHLCVMAVDSRVECREFAASEAETLALMVAQHARYHRVAASYQRLCVLCANPLLGHYQAHVDSLVDVVPVDFIAYASHQL